MTIHVEYGGMVKEVIQAEVSPKAAKSQNASVRTVSNPAEVRTTYPPNKILQLYHYINVFGTLNN
jgi:hypothetical protein